MYFYSCTACHCSLNNRAYSFIYTIFLSFIFTSTAFGLMAWMLFWEKRWQVSSQNQIWTLWLLWSWNFASWTLKTFRFLMFLLLFPKSPALTTLFTTLPSSTLKTGIKSLLKLVISCKEGVLTFLLSLFPLFPVIWPESCSDHMFSSRLWLWCDALVFYFL